MAHTFSIAFLIPAFESHEKRVERCFLNYFLRGHFAVNLMKRELKVYLGPSSVYARRENLMKRELKDSHCS